MDIDYLTAKQEYLSSEIFSLGIRVKEIEGWIARQEEPDAPDAEKNPDSAIINKKLNEFNHGEVRFDFGNLLDVHPGENAAVFLTGSGNLGIGFTLPGGYRGVITVKPTASAEGGDA